MINTGYDTIIREYGSTLYVGMTQEKMEPVTCTLVLIITLERYLS